jgi:hypothetical protein
METIIFILICYGACNNIIYGSIFEGWRNFLANFGTGGYSLYKLFTCFICLGTWMGFAVSLLMYHFDYGHKTPVGSIGITDVYLMTFLNGLLSTAGVWITHTFQEALERHHQKLD